MLASVTAPAAPTVVRTDNPAGSSASAEAEARPRAFRELVGSGRSRRQEADIRAETRRRTGVAIDPATTRPDGRTPAAQATVGGAEGAKSRENLHARTDKREKAQAERSDEKPMTQDVAAAVGAMQGAQRGAAAGPAVDNHHLGIASDDEYERSATEDVGQSATEAPVPTGAEGAGGDIQALQAQGAPIVGDGGAETEGFVEMLASAAALDATDGPAVPAAPAPFSAPTSSATAGDLDQTATNAVLAVAGNLGAPAKAAVRNAEAIELTTAEGAAGSDAAGDPAGLGAAERNGAAASNPAIARASVPSVPGRGGSDRSILVNPNAAVQADEGGGMGIAEKLAAAKLPNAGAERAAMPAIRGGAGEMPIRPAEAPTSFNQTLTEIALSNGFVHRSGDLVGALDRMTAGHGVQPGAAALRPTPVQILPIEIGMQALRGATQFQIRLDPAELGRVEVTLEIKEDGEVKASLVVDRVETLALLKREAPHLQQAFEQAGLRQNADGLSFSLRGDGQQHSQREESAERSHTPLQDDENLRLQREIGEIAMRRVLIPNASLDRVV